MTSIRSLIIIIICGFVLTMTACGKHVEQDPPDPQALIRTHWFGIILISLL